MKITHNEGVISGEDVYAAFWSAAKALGADDAVHGIDYPYFDQSTDMVDTSGCGMPPQFWDHMARALAGGFK